MMKRIVQVICLLVYAVANVYGQEGVFLWDANKIEQTVAKITDTLYAGKIEVTNAMYQSFLEEPMIHDNPQFLVAQIDSTGWVHPPDFHSEELMMTYHLMPQYREHPVVNVSFEGAELFCKWLTEKYNAMPSKIYKKVRFRMPTEDEWMLAARNPKIGGIYTNGDSLKDANGRYYYNFDSNEPEEGGSNTPRPQHALVMLRPSISNPENGFGLYNICGNVSEMITPKGYTKGGCFRDRKEALQIAGKIMYRGSSPAIGFRYFMDILEQ